MEGTCSRGRGAQPASLARRLRDLRQIVRGGLRALVVGGDRVGDAQSQHSQGGAGHPELCAGLSSGTGRQRTVAGRDPHVTPLIAIRQSAQSSQTPPCYLPTPVVALSWVLTLMPMG